MIRAYPRYPSLFPGETLTLHVSTDSPRFRVEFFRQGAELSRMTGLPSHALPGSDLPEGPTDLDWGWTGYDWQIPADWPSGVYVAMLIEVRADGSEIAPDTGSTFATEAKALFVLRHRGPVTPGTPLYKISWATFVAYNATGYGSLYTEALWSREHPQPGFKVTWRRPGCGTGGIVMAGDPPDEYDRRSRRQTFEHWDAPLVRWLEGEGYRPHYCSDWDLQQDPALLRPYSLLLSVGHDEYWSDAMRAAIDAHVARGGNVAFLTGNTAFYRIHFTDDDTAITCAKVLPAARDPDTWTLDYWPRVNPECRLLGVSFLFGGGWWNGRRDALGYTVQHADHWIFAGTGLTEGSVFGDDPDFPLIGYEADGAAFRRVDGRAIPTGELGTPRDFVILGIAEMGEGWVTPRDRGAATMGMYASPRGGIVFQAATTDWPILVGRNAHVAAITRNVMDRLRWPSARLLGPLPARGGRMLAAVGETVSFHVDLARFQPAEGIELHWQVAGARTASSQGPQLRVALPATPGFVTVSVELRRGGAPIGFATRTFIPLSAEEAVKLDITLNLREMAMTDEPATPMVSAAYDPLDRSDLVIPIRLPYLEARAARLVDAVAKALEAGVGQSKVKGDPKSGKDQ